MNAQELTVHPSNYYYVMLREDFLLLAQNFTYKNPNKKKSHASPHCMAFILSVLEHWAENKRGKGQSPWIIMTYQQFGEALYGLFGRNTIIDSVEVLLGEQLIERKPYQEWEKGLYQYRYNSSAVNKRLAALPKRDQEQLVPRGESIVEPDETPTEFIDKPDAFTDKRGSFTDKRGSFTDKPGAFTDKRGSFTDKRFIDSIDSYRLDTDSREREGSEGSAVTDPPPEDAPSPFTTGSSEKMKSCSPAPPLPPDDAPWDTKTCLALFDHWRGEYLFREKKREEATQAATVLVQHHSRQEVTQAYEAMHADPFWREKGPTITQVAEHRMEYLNKLKSRQNGSTSPSKRSLGGPASQMTEQERVAKTQDSLAKARARVEARRAATSA